MSCEGLWYRAERSTFIRTKGVEAVELRLKLLPLKQRTCPGCPECSEMKDIIRERGIVGLHNICPGYWYKAIKIGDYVHLDWDFAKGDYKKRLAEK